MSHTIKLCERIIEHRLRGVTGVQTNEPYNEAMGEDH
jgi:hypothetical protein